ncbi:MAG TPA: hypothetical protein VHY91_26915 [Pirellulales bacterium]|jgi:hypothetical protein|nr:hypothetical protein [Pirellulales bacterium]
MELNYRPPGLSANFLERCAAERRESESITMSQSLKARPALFLAFAARSPQCSDFDSSGQQAGTKIVHARCVGSRLVEIAHADSCSKTARQRASAELHVTIGLRAIGRFRWSNPAQRIGIATESFCTPTYRA